ncbi:outer membrane protein assembly factor [uncultured Cloacibacillus sp.]|uniref:BamA/OMP85 family outer membrane protein n=1 Tax=uncultured Cloacibacillus sp. TaxID=889794 RepID=UPI0026DBA4EA|nr:POTRA domain-containing protein [uncultured Cloacibacillus sp.]
MLKRTKLLALSLAALMVASQTGYAADGSPDAQDSMPSGFSSGAFSDGFSSPSGMQTPQHEEALPEPPSMAELAGPVIMNIGLEGNSEVASEHIMSVVTTKAGEHVDDEKLRKDAEAIFELGFFNATDYRVTDVEGGVNVTFLVQENPKVGEIRFVGNTVYSSEELSKIVFTQPGMIFNRTFFRNDLQRIKEKYQADGYVMANVRDVKIDGDIITVEILEPKVSEIVIQGNRITKTKIIERYIRVKVGEKFNSNELRLTLNRLQGLGYFSDVNVNFEPGENPDEVILVLTVEEARTGRLGFNVAYGTQSGFGGGMSYENTNIWGTGNRLSVGFELGDREEYWLTLEQPYMSHKVFAWRVGVYKRAWDDIYYYEDDIEYLEYDRDRFGAFVGFGKKFAEESKYNWYLLLDWHTTKNENLRNHTGQAEWDRYGKKYGYPAGTDPEIYQAIIKEEELGEGDYYSATATFRRFNLDEYLPYQKGDIESINVQVGQADVEGVDYSYVKYWLEGRFYYPIGNFLKDIFETSFLDGVDGKPVILAARVIAGSSSGDVPYDELYEVGGDTTLRGYDDDYYHGRNIVLGNVELRVPIQKMFTLVFFYDIGRAWDSGKTRNGREVVYGDDDWGDSPGVGVRLNTPLGNLRLDYASGDEDRFVFGFGELF